MSEWILPLSGWDCILSGIGGIRPRRRPRSPRDTESSSSNRRPADRNARKCGRDKKCKMCKNERSLTTKRCYRCLVWSVGGHMHNRAPYSLLQESTIHYLHLLAGGFLVLTTVHTRKKEPVKEPSKWHKTTGLPCIPGRERRKEWGWHREVHIVVCRRRRREQSRALTSVYACTLLT